MTYQEFLKTKELKTISAGFDVPDDWLSDKLFPYQKDIVKWALKKGKSAILTGCGTGKTLQLIEKLGGQWLIWVDYNDESDVLKHKIPNCVEVKGSDEPEKKAQASLDFASGDINCLVSKPSIFGFGSNFQKCHNMIFCGLSDSYERFYQAVRRCWRFGQTQEVNVYIILSERERIAAEQEWGCLTM